MNVLGGINQVVHAKMVCAFATRLQNARDVINLDVNVSMVSVYTPLLYSQFKDVNLHNNAKWYLYL